jgi:ABC-type polysaccharide/polyol phosphate export permease
VAVIVRGTLDPALVVLPVLLALLGAFVLGIGLAVAVLHAYYRDVAPILSAVLFPWFLVTPIFFRPTDFPGQDKLSWLGEALRWGNPVAPFIEAVRDVLFYGRLPGAGIVAYVALAAVLAVAGGRFVFRRLEAELAVVL